MIMWNWSGPESKTESSRSYYRLARVMVNIFVGMWGFMLVWQVVSLFQTKALLLALGTIALFQAIRGEPRLSFEAARWDRRNILTLSCGVLRKRIT